MGEEEIKLPEFDEEKFKETERRKAKTSLTSFFFGIIIATISRFLWSNMDESIRWPLIFLFAIACIGFLAKIFQYIKIDIRAFSKKEWMGSIFFYFFTWLAFFILLMNPPFYDASPPKIEVSVLPLIQEINENATIFARITDNAGIKDIKINVDGFHKMERYKEFYVYNFSGNGEIPFTITATDVNGHSSSFSGIMRFQKNVLYIKEKNGSTMNSSHIIKIWVLKNVSNKNFRVFCIVNGVEINATYFGEEGEYFIYKTSPEYEGWKQGENNFQACAEVIDYMKGSKTKLSAIIKGKEYLFNVENDSNISTIPSPPIKNLPRAPSLRTPGFGVAGALAAFLLLFWRRKK